MRGRRVRSKPEGMLIVIYLKSFFSLLLQEMSFTFKTLINRERMYVPLTTPKSCPVPQFIPQTQHCVYLFQTFKNALYTFTCICRNILYLNGIVP